LPAAKIIVSNFQILHQLPGVLSSAFPPAVQELVESLAPFNVEIFEALDTRCSFTESLYTRFVRTMLLPFVGAGALILLGVLESALTRPAELSDGRFANVVRQGAAELASQASEALEEAGDKGSILTVAKQRGLVMLFLLYPSLNNAVFRIWTCRQFENSDHGEVAYNPYDYTVDCTTTTYMIFWWLAFAGFALYSVGIPFYFLVILKLNNKGGAKDTQTRDDDGSDGGGEGDDDSDGDGDGDGNSRPEEEATDQLDFLTKE
jgi:hypothetical protein